MLEQLFRTLGVARRCSSSDFGGCRAEISSAKLVKALFFVGFVDLEGSVISKVLWSRFAFSSSSDCFGCFGYFVFLGLMSVSE